MASLLCGLFAPLVLGLSALPAVILGHKARAEIQRTREQGEGAAMTGLILGWIWMALGFLIMLLDHQLRTVVRPLRPRGCLF